MDRLTASLWAEVEAAARCLHAKAAVQPLQAKRPPSPPSLRQGGQLRSPVALPTKCDIGAHRIERFVPYLERNPAPGTEDDVPQPPFTIDVRALSGS